MLLLEGVLVAQPITNDFKKRSRYFKDYMREMFPDFKICDGEYLFILQTGCRNCIEQSTDYLSAHPNLITEKYQAMLVSASTLKRMPSNLWEKVPNLLCDTTNKLDRMSFGIDGVSVLKIKKGRIEARKSMTPEDLRNPKDFFVPIETQ